MKKIDKKIEEKLNILKHTRPRDIMPRPTVFKDESKYDRKRDKQLIKKETKKYLDK